MLNDDRCFLERDVWQNVFTSAVFETGALSDSSEIIVSLWTNICPIPSLFKDVQKAVCTFTDIDRRSIGSLFARARDIWTFLMQWCLKVEEILLSHSPPEQLAAGKYHETLGMYMTNFIIINRLSVSLDTRAGLDFEDETQNLARRIIAIEQKARAASPRARLFLAFKVIVARATLHTKYEWQQAIRLSIEDHASADSVISSQVFNHWVSLKGRKTTSWGSAGC